MQDLYLMQQILTFVERMRMVEERQVRAFFSDQGRYETEYALHKLKDMHRIHNINGGSRISTNLKINNANNYDSVIDALDVMVQLRSKDVNWYALRDLPFELEFCVDNYSTMFTVSVFDIRNWAVRYEQTKRLRSINLPIGEEDPRKHIAVISDSSLIEKLEPLGFDMFVKIKDRATGELEKWNYKSTNA